MKHIIALAFIFIMLFASSAQAFSLIEVIIPVSCQICLASGEQCDVCACIVQPQQCPVLPPQEENQPEPVPGPVEEEVIDLVAVVDQPIPEINIFQPDDEFVLNIDNVVQIDEEENGGHVLPRFNPFIRFRDLILREDPEPQQPPQQPQDPLQPEPENQEPVDHQLVFVPFPRLVPFVPDAPANAGPLDPQEPPVEEPLPLEPLPQEPIILPPVVVPVQNGLVNNVPLQHPAKACSENNFAQIERVSLTPEALLPFEETLLHVIVTDECQSRTNLRVSVDIPQLGFTRSSSQFDLEQNQAQDIAVPILIPFDANSGDFIVKIVLKNDYLHQVEYRYVSVDKWRYIQ
ncbi:hypothetical protein HYV86_06600 [Candidatus Woesearchaeota archaeon]|nr:hypothetical protein [Candidatus Woesearchaeota archaeon]